MDNKYVYITIISVTIIIVLSLLGTLIAVLFKKKMSKDVQSTYKELPIINEIYELLKEQKNISTEKFKNFDDSINNIKERLALFNEKIKSELKDEINNKLNELSMKINKSLSDNIQASGDNFQKLRLEINSQIEKLITKTNEQVENIKKEIDEHFKSELSKKLDEHFSNVQTKMNDLSNNLVKLETLKDNVNDLSKAFNNTKSIGNFGEILLEDILRDHFGNNNFWKKQVNISKIDLNIDINDLNTSDDKSRVDFIVKYPIGKDEIRYLPIDCKFPLIKYYNVIDEAADKIERDKAIKEYIKQIKLYAKEISEKYIRKNITTDFALMYLPSESLYATALSSGNDLLGDVWSKYKIGLVSPSTIHAQMRMLIEANKQLEFSKNLDQISDLINSIHKNYGFLVKNLETSKKKIQDSYDNVEKGLKNVRRVNTAIEKISQKGYINFDKQKDVLKLDQTEENDDSDQNDDIDD